MRTAYDSCFSNSGIMVLKHKKKTHRVFLKHANLTAVHTHSAENPPPRYKLAQIPLPPSLPLPSPFPSPFPSLPPLPLSPSLAPFPYPLPLSLPHHATLHFSSPQPMSLHVNNIIYPPRDLVVPTRVPQSPVPAEVESGVRPVVDVQELLVISVDGASHAWPGLADAEVA